MADGKTVMGERKKTIKTTLLLITILPCLVVCVVLTYLGSSSIKRNMQSATIDGLKYTAVALNAAMHAVNQEDFVLSEDNHLLKGALDLSANPEFIDSFVEGTNAQVTIFYGNTRYATSIIDEKGERMVGTTCSDEIFDTVVNKGQEFKTNSAVFAGQTYYAYYMPLRNADGTPVGIVFAGCPTEKADEVSMSAVATLAGVSFIAQIICVIAGILSAVKIAKGIRESAGYLESVANGDLNIEVSDTLLSRKDEFGQMGADFVLLSDNLKKIMGTIQSSAQSVLTSGDQLKSMATQTSSTADEISHAVDDIAKGAISQAEDVECATVKVNEMGEMIEEIVRQIEALDETSAVMKEAGDASAAIMEELAKSNDETVEAIDEVAKNVAATDESVARITEAVSLISAIAAQTNLLSLNASIEAARAGEAGKGFAVVATEIQKLSVESNESTGRIKDAITELSNDSKRSMEVMAQVQDKLAEQQNKLVETRQKFDSVSQGINTSKAGTDEISGHAKTCDTARAGVVDIVANLSALSEENAASSQQTTASMQELNNTITQLADSSSSLKDLAFALQEETKFFKL